MTIQGIELQKPHNFTVAILHGESGKRVGTGVVVTTNQIITCAHVVKEAGVKLPNIKDSQVGIFFQATGDERRAKVIACFEDCDDDFALLQLTEGDAPLGPEQIAVLGTLENASFHQFRAFGYAVLGPQENRWIDGQILGPVTLSKKKLRAQVYELRTQDIGKGHSGAAVLDIEDNLVVGLVTRRWNPEGTAAIDNVGHGTDTVLLSFDPFKKYGIPLRDTPLAKKPGPQPNIPEETMAAVKQVARPQPEEGMRRAPAPIDEWVGRDELLQQLSADFDDPAIRITGLVGFGGEGKSSLARRWIDQAGVEDVFWWSFYDDREVERFFEAALTYLAGPDLTAQVTSASVRAGIIAQLLRERRTLFVLDGFEVMQHQEGDHYGQLTSRELVEFLGYFAGLEHNSFCLITTRTPLMEMIHTASYRHRDVNRLSETDGRDLLRELGVDGSDDDLTRLVNTWDGHALTLTLLGTYVREKLGGDLTKLDEKAPLAEEDRYERVHRVLRRYDEYLDEADQAFLTLFSAFRTPVKEAAFPAVFRQDMGADALNAPLAALDDFQFEEILVRLRGYRILRYDPAQQHYTTHPLIREHYAKRFGAATEAQQQQIHTAIKEYYLKLANEGESTKELSEADQMMRRVGMGSQPIPTLDDLTPLIEAVHHACCAGAYDEAFDPIFWQRIYQRNRQLLRHILGAYETSLAIMQEFFLDGDISQEPQASKPSVKSFILNEVGLCLMSLGRLAEAVPPYEQSAKMDSNMKDWRNASTSYQGLATLQTHLGALAVSAKAAQEALDLARRMEPGRDRQRMECASLSYMGRAAHLRGEIAAAGEAFREAEAVQKQFDPDVKYLYSLRGIQHANHLRRAGEMAYARRLAEANLEICEHHRVVEQISQCYRVLGDLDADAGQTESARQHYDEALRITRGITKRNVLIEALLGLGRLLARHPQLGESARPYLDEALDYCEKSHYRIYEADCRAALAWMHHSEGNKDAARAEAMRAKSLSEQIGYHWGMVDAEEVLAAL